MIPLPEHQAEDPMLIAKLYANKQLGSFSMGLMDLFGKADHVNQIKLGKGFPEYYLAYQMWFNGAYK
jgi:hypothetical protein